MFNLDGRVALITGAARGIGLETALTLERQGATVVVADILQKELDELLARCGQDLLGIRCIHLDVTSSKSWGAASEYIDREFGRLDVMVNNAGIMRSRSFFETDIDDFRKAMSVNAESVFLGAKAMLSLLKIAGETNPAGAAIINISSVYGEIAGPWNTAYCASKGAVRMLTKALAVDLAQAKTNIRVNAVQPGAIDTTMLRNSLGALVDAGVLASAQEADQMVSATTPIGRLGRPDDIAGIVAFLASDAAKFMTGAVVTSDGGFSIV